MKNNSSILCLKYNTSINIFCKNEYIYYIIQSANQISNKVYKLIYMKFENEHKY